MATQRTRDRLLAVLTGIVLLGGCASTATSTPAPTTTLATPAPTAVSPPSPGDTSAMAPTASRPTVVEAERVTCPPGTYPDTPGPVGQARPPLAYSMPIAFDRRAGRIVLLTQGGYPRLFETWTFDVCTNNWTQMHPTRDMGASQLVYDVDSDRTIGVDPSTGGVWAYDLEADAWTEKAHAPMTMTRQPRLVYDSASDLVLMLASTKEVESALAELWSYDVETDIWAPVDQKGAVPDVQSAHEGLLAFDPSVDRLVLYDRALYDTRLFDLRTGTWSHSNTDTPTVNFGWGASGGEVAYDEATKQSVVASYGRVIAYDAAASSWEILVPGGLPGDSTRRWGPWMVYDPVNRRLVVYGGQYGTSDGTWVQADDVLAFDPATREWTVLLAASTVQPAPS